jgi:RimJ/RimL family protein N-acetyltransferase
MVYTMNLAIEKLATPLADAIVGLELLSESHREGLRSVCAEDQEIWDIYPVSMIDEYFDPAFEAMKRLVAGKGWVTFAVLQESRVVGMSSYINPDAAGRTVEIGGTFIAPSVRGGPFNRAMKQLMIDHALACGFTRIEFRVDTRNTRSMAAVLKLGATHEGTLRKNRITWTGFVRDTAVFGLLDEEWRNS